MEMASFIRALGTSMREVALQVWPELTIMPATPLRDVLGEIRVIENDVRTLAAQLLAHPLDGRRSALRNLNAGAAPSR